MTRPFRKGDVVLVPFPFTDLSAAKFRPAVIVSPDPKGPDFVVAYVSSIVPAGSVPPLCLLIATDHREFPATGLKRTSVVRLDKLLTIARSRVQRRLGHLGPSLLAGLDSCFRAAFGV